MIFYIHYIEKPSTAAIHQKCHYNKQTQLDTALSMQRTRARLCTQRRRKAPFAKHHSLHLQLQEHANGCEDCSYPTWSRSTVTSRGMGVRPHPSLKQKTSTTMSSYKPCCRCTTCLLSIPGRTCLFVGARPRGDH